MKLLALLLTGRRPVFIKTAVTARLRTRTGRHRRNTQRNQTVSQFLRLASRQYDRGMRQKHPQSAKRLHELDILHKMILLKIPSRRTHPRQTDRYLRFPTPPRQIKCMRRQCNRFITPIVKSEKRSDSEPPKSRRISPLRRFHSPEKTGLRSF